MTPIHLNLNNLFGFKIIAGEARPLEQVILGAKVGDKVGTKTVSSDIRIGAKIGGKPGFKSR